MLLDSDLQYWHGISTCLPKSWIILLTWTDSSRIQRQGWCPKIPCCVLSDLPHGLQPSTLSTTSCFLMGMAEGHNLDCRALCIGILCLANYQYVCIYLELISMEPLKLTQCCRLINNLWVEKSSKGKLCIVLIKIQKFFHPFINPCSCHSFQF